MTEYNDYRSFAEKLLKMSTRNPESNICKNYSKASAIIFELLNALETDIDPEKDCPYDLVCRHANTARKVVTYLVDALMAQGEEEEDEDVGPVSFGEVRVFTRLDGNNNGPEV
ncbi:MAG: hypothetical protein J5706_04690 [Elusimicrobiales bacterium]|nr:hypothetical protein [Elusimicrobiales bacterium]